MKVFFLGSCPPIHLQNRVKSWGSHVDFAGYKLQSLLIKGLECYYADIKIITTLWIQPFPKAKKVFLKRQLFSHNGDTEAKDVFCGLLNLPLIKKVSQYCRLAIELRKSINLSEDNVIFSYALTSYSLLALLPYCNKAKTCVIVPDLPEFMSGSKNLLYRFAKKVDYLIIKSCLKHIDSFVLLSELMAQKLCVLRKKPFVVVEGICEDVECQIRKQNNPEKVLMYTGALDHRYGILDLVEAVHRINNSEIKLFLYGMGDSIKQIIDYSRIDSRIQYKGVVQPEEVLRLLQDAFLLVNPRHSTEEFTKYSFPSKTMEYMLSGTPVLMCKLAAIPQEYDEFLYFFDDESIEGMQQKIEDVLLIPIEVLEAKGRSASVFIQREKNPKAQSKRIVEMIANIK